MNGVVHQPDTEGSWHNACFQVGPCPPVEPAQLALQKPQAHLIQSGVAGERLARCSLWWEDTPSWNGAATGLIGHFESVEDVAGTELVRSPPRPALITATRTGHRRLVIRYRRCRDAHRDHDAGVTVLAAPSASNFAGRVDDSDGCNLGDSVSHSDVASRDRSDSFRRLCVASGRRNYKGWFHSNHFDGKREKDDAASKSTIVLWARIRPERRGGVVDDRARFGGAAPGRGRR